MQHASLHGDCVWNTQRSRPKRRRSRRKRQSQAQSMSARAAEYATLRGRRTAKRVALSAIRTATSPLRGSATHGLPWGDSCYVLPKNATTIADFETLRNGSAPSKGKYTRTILNEVRRIDSGFHRATTKNTPR